VAEMAVEMWLECCQD